MPCALTGLFKVPGTGCGGRPTDNHSTWEVAMGIIPAHTAEKESPDEPSMRSFPLPLAWMCMPKCSSATTSGTTSRLRLLGTSERSSAPRKRSSQRLPSGLRAAIQAASSWNPPEYSGAALIRLWKTAVLRRRSWCSPMPAM